MNADMDITHKNERN